MESACQIIDEYSRFYVAYGQTLWHGLTPLQYGGILIFIAVAGYALMKSGMKGP